MIDKCMFKLQTFPLVSLNEERFSDGHINWLDITDHNKCSYANLHCSLKKTNNYRCDIYKNKKMKKKKKQTSRALQTFSRSGR
jgi:hypothetical protein